MYGADGAGVSVSALVAHHAHTLDRQQDREGLPDLLVESSGLDFGHDDIVGFLKQRDPLRRDLAKDADGKPRAGKRLALQDVFRHLEVSANAADLIFEEVPQRLDELKLHRFGQSADVVVALDSLRRAFHGRRLDDVRVERAPHQPVDSTGLLRDAVSLIVEDADELVADDLALRLRIGNTSKPRKEPPAGVDSDEIQPELFPQVLLNFEELVLAQNAIVDENAGEAISNRPVHENGRNRGI